MNKPLFDLSGKITLVTGSGGGIGLTLARGLGEAGAMVVLNGRNEEKLKTAEMELRKEGIDTFASCFDITEEEDVVRAIAEIQSEIGPVDVLVNNAGVQKRGSLETIEYTDFEQVLKTNLSGAFLVSKHVVKSMIERRRGKIINICSLMSELGRKMVGPYAAAKGGLKMLTRAMAVDWAEYNIQVNGIGPGYFLTDITRPLANDPDFDSWLKRRTPAGRWGDPAELIGTAVYLASGASDFVTGQIIIVDGGITASL